MRDLLVKNCERFLFVVSFGYNQGMRFFRKFFTSGSNLLFLVLIVLAWFVLVVSNFSFGGGTFLAGWDNLVPEFNFRVNILRSFSAVWQEYQGVGLLGGMGHAADLPRQIILLFLSFFVSLSYLRYVWIFGMLLLGPLGVYFLVKYLVRESLASFLAALFYLFNFSTVQTFFVPFETFVSFFGFLPWLLLVALRCLDERENRCWLKFFVISLLAAPSFYVQTLFIVWMMILSVFLIEHILRKGEVERVVKLLGVTFVANAFWLLPVFWFSLKGSGVLLSTKTSVMPTIEQKLMNRSFGNLSNIARFQGFWLEYTDANLQNTDFEYLMPLWRDWLGKGNVEIVGYALFIVSIFGILMSVAKGRKWRVSVGTAMILGILMLTGGAGILGVPYAFLARVIPLFGQMFRSTFTKWSVAFSLFYGLGIGFFVVWVGDVVGRKFRLVTLGVAGLLFTGIVWQVKPVFWGQLVSPAMRVDFPEEYLELFEYFESQPRQVRIARFPVHTFWGWDFYDWGYRGSGFLWYGVKQPVLDRAFDVWSGKNETYFYEISTALYRDDSEAFEWVLRKYDVGYALIDKSVVVPESEGGRALRFEETEGMLEEIGGKMVFGKNFLSVYELPWIRKSFVSAPGSYTLADGGTIYGRHDVIYEQNGDYINGETFYPFADLYKERVEGVNYEDGRLKIRRIGGLNGNDVGYRLIVPGFGSGQRVSASAAVVYDGGFLKIDFEPLVEVKVGEEIYKWTLPSVFVGIDGGHEKIKVSIGEVGFEISDGEAKIVEGMEFVVEEGIRVQVFDIEERMEVDLGREFLNQGVSKCWEREGVEGFVKSLISGRELKIVTRDAVGCLSFKLEGVRDSFVEISLPFRSDDGARPHFCVLREGEQVKCEHGEVFYAVASSSEWSEVSREMILREGVFWLSVVGRPSDEEGKEWSIYYKSPEVVYYPRIVDYVIQSSVWSDFTDERIIEFGGDDSYLEVELVSDERRIDFSENGLLEPKNCDLFERGIITKVIRESGVEYVAEDWGASCDYVYLAGVLTDREYLLRFVGENVSGRSVKAYLYNHASERNDLEILLPEKKFDVFYGVLGWPRFEKKVYTLNFETRSFGGKSINRIDGVEIYKMPLNWLSRWRVEPEGGIEKIESDVRIEEVEKWGTALYRVRVGGEGLIVLSQGYESGWVAFARRPNFRFSISNLRKLEHVKVNGWSNGWMVPEGEHEIYIFYWPQILQWGGFFVLTLVCGGFIIDYFRKK